MLWNTVLMMLWIYLSANSNVLLTLYRMVMVDSTVLVEYYVHMVGVEGSSIDHSDRVQYGMDMMIIRVLQQLFSFIPYT